jgi:2-amino-4-hydroxy-6-hydroxymethyldihydropteridine diphosphokinase
MTTHWAYLSIGSNLGDPLQNCCRGIELLCADSRIEMISRSPFYWTQPVDFVDQAWFLNAALKIRTDLPPPALLDRMQAVQTALGRKERSIRFGPRILDLDIIFYQDCIMKTPQLTIPHPRMHKRRFVLQPICDIDPEVVHPVLHKNVFRLLNQLDTNDQEMKPCLSDC